MLHLITTAPECAPRWSAADRSLLVESIARPQWRDSRLVLDTIPVAPYTKHYEDDEEDTPPAAESHVAHVDGQTAGELRCSPHWNGYLYVHDVVVRAEFRRQGVGRALVQRAILRSQELQLGGVMLETQNTNLPACRLYASCGLELGGFDGLLYRALTPPTTEIALFWYWLPSGSR